mgnify:CR=1 FL=1
MNTNTINIRQRRVRRTVFIDPEIAASMQLAEPAIDWSAVANEAFRFRLKLLRMQRAGYGDRRAAAVAGSAAAAVAAPEPVLRRPVQPVKPRRPASAKPANVSVDEIRRRMAERREAAGVR